MGKLSRLAALSLALLLIPALIRPGAVDPPPIETQLPRVDVGLQQSLENVLSRLRLDGALRNHRLAVSLVDVTDINDPRYSGVNDREMMYAASLPKIAILLAGFEKIAAGRAENDHLRARLKTSEEKREHLIKVAKRLQERCEGLLAQLGDDGPADPLSEDETTSS